MPIKSASLNSLPEGDYVSPNLSIVRPDAAFQRLMIGDAAAASRGWPYFRRWVKSNWYVDGETPDCGFVNRDEASILYNNALLFQGKACLEIGCWRGWSSVHLAMASGSLDIIEPLFDDPNVVKGIVASFDAAGVLEKVRLHAGYSPAAVDQLAQANGTRWSLVFIDGNHEGEASRLDAEAAIRNCAETAMILFHDLASPDVASGLDMLRNAGWRTMVYQTMQIMGVAWRGEVEPVAHTPDPKIFWTLPRHLSGHEVSGWKPPHLPYGGTPWLGMTIEDERNAAHVRAQLAEDQRNELIIKLRTQSAQFEIASKHARDTEAELSALVANRHDLEALSARMSKQMEELAAERDTAVSQLLDTKALVEQVEKLSAERDIAVSKLLDIEVRLTEASESRHSFDELHRALEARFQQLELDHSNAIASVKVMREAAAYKTQADESDRAVFQARIEHTDKCHLAALAHVEWLESQLSAQRAHTECAIRERATALLVSQRGMLLQLAHWCSRPRVLTGLLRRSSEARIDCVASQARTLGISDTIPPAFMHWLCRRRTLVGLLRRGPNLAAAIIFGSMENLGQTVMSVVEAVYPEADPVDAGRALPPSSAYEDQEEWRLWADALQLLRQIPAFVAKGGFSHSAEARRIYFDAQGLDDATATILAQFFDVKHGQKIDDGKIEFVSRSIKTNKYFIDILNRIRLSPYFNESYYKQRYGVDWQISDAALHYLLIGEISGLCPSANFNPMYYGKRNKDVSQYGLSLLLHYTEHGRSEGRRCVPPSSRSTLQLRQPIAGLENVIVVVHETSRTGAPILGWNIARELGKKYNIYTVLLADGALTSDFEDLSIERYGPFVPGCRDAVDAEFALANLFSANKFKYAIVNSIESRCVVDICAMHSVPTVLLVHEFSSYVKPEQSLIRAFDLASEIVFPAAIVAEAALSIDGELPYRRTHIEPQGMSIIPGNQVPKLMDGLPGLTRMSQAKQDGAFIVMGAGSVNLRKGVDLFISVAAAVGRMSLDRSVEFFWIGGGYDADNDLGYSIYLKEQIDRSGPNIKIHFVDEVPNLDPFYDIADIFLLSSRLDPLPNVTIDAAHRGIPIVCFRDATGIAEILLEDKETAAGVIPHLDTFTAAQVVKGLAGDEARQRHLGEATKRLALKRFDMEKYVSRLDDLGVQASERIAKRLDIINNLREMPRIWFDPIWYSKHYGVPEATAYENFLANGLTQNHAPSQAVKNIIDTLAPGSMFTKENYADLLEVTSEWPFSISAESLATLSLLFEAEWHSPARNRLSAFLGYLREGLPRDVNPGPLFDAAFYRTRVQNSDLPPLSEGDNSAIHWLQYGQPKCIVPTDRFDEEYYQRANPDIQPMWKWGFAHYIKHGKRENRLPKRWYDFSFPSSSVMESSDPVKNLYAQWHTADFPPLSALYPSTVQEHQWRLNEFLLSEEMAEIFTEAQAIEPDVGDVDSINAFVLPPFNDVLATAHLKVRHRLPRSHYDNVICVPWIRTGGADFVAGLLAKSLLRIRPDEQVLILRVDHPHFERADWLPSQADCVDLSDITVELALPAAENLLRIILRGVGAKRVFNVNSRICWSAMRSHGANLAKTLRTYSYMFCWDQTPSGRRVGYPTEFFPGTARTMTAFLTDTIYLRDEIDRLYHLPASVKQRIVPLFSPAQTQLAVPSVTETVFHNADDSTRSVVLWAGRLDRQKRFDLVQEIAELMPDVEFRCWGAAILDTSPDISKIPQNIVMKGEFNSFDDLPLIEAGAWLFTSGWEGMPTTLIELATRGVTIIASSVGGVPELIRDDTGWPVDAHANAKAYVTALREALGSPEEAVRRAKRLQERVGKIYNEESYDSALDAILNAEQEA